MQLTRFRCVEVLKVHFQRWAIVSVLSIGMLVSMKAQDLVFSQFYLTPTYLNPGFTGMTDAPRFNLNYRYQFPSFGVAYKSLMFSADKSIEQFNSGLGIRLALDDAGSGILKNTSVSFNYSYRLRFKSAFKLHMGVDMTLAQLRLDRNKLIFGDQLDPNVGPIIVGGQLQGSEDLIDSDQRTYLSTGFGVIAKGDRFFAGVSLHNVNSPDISFLERIENGDLPIRSSVQLGAFIPLRDLGVTSYASLNPVVYFTRQRQHFQLTSGVIWHSDIFQFGLLYRQVSNNPDAVVFSLGMERDIIRVGYSYDFTVSKLAGSTGGTHELGLLINLDKAEGHKKETQFNDCFSIFR